MTGERLSGRYSRSRGAGAAALLGLAVGLAVAIGPAHSEKVGVAAAVTPDAFSSLSGSPQSQLNIGKSIFYNERINTTGSGLVQVLLVDGSTFTVGPGSDLVIDKFVYDPKKGTGQVTASFSKGVMRFVGGKLSKNDGGVTVNTPAGALAIRGGIAFVDFKSAKNFSILFVFGEYLKLQGKTVYEPGYGFFSSNGHLVTKPFTAADVKAIIAALTNSSGGFAGNTDNGKANPPSKLVNTQPLNQLIADATQTQIQGEIEKQLNQPVPNTPTCPPTCEPVPPPRDGGEFNGYAVGFVDNGEGRPGLIATLTPDDLRLLLEPDLEEGGVIAGIRFHRAGLNGLLPWTKTYDLTFTGAPADYVHDSDFWAFGQAGQSNIKVAQSFINYTQVRVLWWTVNVPYIDVAHWEGTPEPFTGSFSSRGSTNANLPPPEGLPEELCQECDFIKWGFWDASVSYGEGNTAGSDSFNNGLWVAGTLATVGEIDTLAATGGTATYAGTAIGNVARLDPELGWMKYQATGDMHMDWNFGQRSGDLTISEFDKSPAFLPDGLSVSGKMITPGQIDTTSLNKHQFGGVLTGSGLVGAATGSFVKNGDNVAAGVIGNWGAGGIVNQKPYEVIGIFGGRQSNFTPAP